MKNEKINILDLQAKVAQIALDLQKPSSPKTIEAKAIIDLSLFLTHALQEIARLQGQVAALQLQSAGQGS